MRALGDAAALVSSLLLLMMPLLHARTQPEMDAEKKKLEAKDAALAEREKKLDDKEARLIDPGDLRWSALIADKQALAADKQSLAAAWEDYYRRGEPHRVQAARLHAVHGGAIVRGSRCGVSCCMPPSHACPAA